MFFQLRKLSWSRNNKGKLPCWSWNMADESKHGVGGKKLSPESCTVSSLYCFLYASLSLRQWRLNAPSDKMPDNLLSASMLLSGSDTQRCRKNDFPTQEMRPTEHKQILNTQWFYSEIQWSTLLTKLNVEPEVRAEWWITHRSFTHWDRALSPRWLQTLMIFC